jgi:hypothetical protein
VGRKPISLTTTCVIPTRVDRYRQRRRRRRPAALRPAQPNNPNKEETNMEESTRKSLSAPFPESQVKTRPGSFGHKTVQYVEASAIISRLSDVCQGDWSFTILSHEVLESGEVLVHARLEALGVRKESFGRCASISKDGEVIRSLGDCFKSAATESLKVCARLMGIGAYLYSDEPIEQPDAESAQPKPRKAPLLTNRASSKQVSAIWSLGRRLGLDANAIRARSTAEHGAFPEQLDRQAASAFIGELANEIDGQKGAA